MATDISKYNVEGKNRMALYPILEKILAIFLSVVP
jgi:hypothetical protein